MRTAAIRPEARGARAALAQLGSGRLTLALLASLGIAVALVGRDAGPASSTLAAPLALLAANLAAAIATRRAFRAQPALLAFHVALLAVVTLAAVGRLTYLDGTLELSEGEEFAGVLQHEASGPLHARSLERAAFTNVAFSVDYEPGLKRARTLNRVAFSRGGAERVRTIGDDTPLRLAGYRFHTTSNKGFAPEFYWLPAGGGEPVRGTIHLPSFPARLERQELDWIPPGGTRALRTRLEIEERVVELEGSWRLAPPRRHALVIESGEERATLRPGESWQFSDGTLRYMGLRMWMGYGVSHDWTRPWVLAAALVAAGALAWHYGARFRREPWQRAGGAR